MSHLIGQNTFQKLISHAESNQVIKHTKEDGSALFMIPYDSERHLVVIENNKFTQRFQAKYLVHSNENENVGLKDLPEFVFEYSY